MEVFRHVEPVLQQIPALNVYRLHFSLFRLVNISRTLHIQSPAGPRAQPPGCGPTTKTPGLLLWGHIPRLKRALDQPATGSQRIHLGMPRRAQTVRCRSQSLTASSRAMSVHRASHRAAAAGDRISNRRRTVSSSLISLNRYTTLKIAGAAHKLSTSRFSEPTFWKLPGTGHKMTIKVVTLSKVCDPFCA